MRYPKRNNHGLIYAVSSRLNVHILLITRHYPPECSGGARRPMLYTKALRTLGHRVTLVTPFALDDQDCITVSNTPINRGLNKTSINNSITPPPWEGFKKIFRQWLFWPDPDIRWAKDVVTTVQKTAIHPDWILTTSPPESVHYAGAMLSQKLGCPWVAEFRDTWVDFPHRDILERSNLRAKIERRIAKTYLSKCTAVVAVSKTVMAEIQNYLPKNTPQCTLSHFSDKPPPPHQFETSKFNLVHAGGFNLSDRRRNLEALLVVLQAAFIQKPNIVLHIAGPLTTEETSLAQNSIVPTVLHGAVSLNTSRALQAGADALVLHTPDKSHALPGKYAEYIMTDRPILYLGGGDWISLVDNPDNLRPLATSLVNLRKGETVSRTSQFTDKDAAQLLIKFLSTTAY